MKLNLVPARTGIQWVKLGIQTFLRQPVGLSGLFFVYMAVASLLSLLPVVGQALALVITPAATLGMLVACKEAAEGRFPLPTVLASAFRAGRQRLRAMLQLGLIYAVCVQVVVILTALVVGNDAAAQKASGEPSAATLVLFIFFVPISIAFWFAPALVHWHGVPPVKSIFFSLVAVFSNLRAFALYALTWSAFIAAIVFVVGTVLSLMGSPTAAPAVLMPIVLIVAVMVIASTYFSFIDSFATEAPPAPESNNEPPTENPP